MEVWDYFVLGLLYASSYPWQTIKKIYHANVLRKAGHAPPNFPTMVDLWSNQDEKVDIEKELDVSKNKNINVYFCVAYSHYFSTYIHRVINRLKKYFNLSWLKVRISYHRLNNLAELIYGDLAAKIGRGIFSKYLMDRECNCSLPSKFNGNFVYEGKYRSKCIIYEVKCSICDDVYTGNTQQTFKKRTEGHFSDILRLLKNGQNQSHLLPNLNITLTFLRHVHIYVSIWHLKW